MKAAFLISVVALFSMSCKKEYICECFNPGGVFRTEVIRDTKSGAKDACGEISAEYQTIPWSETACSIKE